MSSDLGAFLDRYGQRAITDDDGIATVRSEAPTRPILARYHDQYGAAEVDVWEWDNQESEPILIPLFDRPVFRVRPVNSRGEAYVGLGVVADGIPGSYFSRASSNVIEIPIPAHHQLSTVLVAPEILGIDPSDHSVTASRTEVVDLKCPDANGVLIEFEGFPSSHAIDSWEVHLHVARGPTRSFEALPRQRAAFVSGSRFWVPFVARDSEFEVHVWDAECSSQLGTALAEGSIAGTVFSSETGSGHVRVVKLSPGPKSAWTHGRISHGQHRLAHRAVVIDIQAIVRTEDTSIVRELVVYATTGSEGEFCFATPNELLGATCVKFQVECKDSLGRHCGLIGTAKVDAFAHTTTRIGEVAVGQAPLIVAGRVVGPEDSAVRNRLQLIDLASGHIVRAERMLWLPDSRFEYFGYADSPNWLAFARRVDPDSVTVSGVLFGPGRSRELLIRLR